MSPTHVGELFEHFGDSNYSQLTNSSGRTNKTPESVSSGELL